MKSEKIQDYGDLIMKFSELEELLADYEHYVKYSVLYSEVHFGCDCGCGGDSYTSEQWNNEIKLAHKTIKKVEQFCKNCNIAYDGLE